MVEALGMELAKVVMAALLVSSNTSALRGGEAKTCTHPLHHKGPELVR
jgi:hypothetical protein